MLEGGEEVRECGSCVEYKEQPYSGLVRKKMIKYTAYVVWSGDKKV